MKRIVVGARSGLKEWVVQRGTAVLMVLSIAAWAVSYMYSSPSGYAEWSAFMDGSWMRVVTFLFVVSLAWHAWIGGRDICMDYIKHDGLRMVKQFGLIVWLAACVVWSAGILWR